MWRDAAFRFDFYKHNSPLLIPIDFQCTHADRLIYSTFVRIAFVVTEEWLFSI